jgi:hypothetical protein
MAWIKRHLFFVIGGAVALALLGAAGFYDYQEWSDNSAQLDSLHDTYNKLGELAGPTVLASKDNTELARTQEAQVRDWIKQAATHFQSIPPIPDPGANGIDSERLGATLRDTIIQLQHEGETAGVALPPKYHFSFESEAGGLQMIMKFAPASLSMLPVQLGQVKAISEVVYGAHVNALDSIQRVRVSEDDAGGPPTDYIDESIVTNNLAVITPYVITFRCFTPELADVLSGFANSPNGFVVSRINVQQAAGGTTGATTPEYAGRPGVPATGIPGAPKMLPIVLKEQLLRVTLEVRIVNLLLK